MGARLVAKPAFLSSVAAMALPLRRAFARNIGGPQHQRLGLRVFASDTKAPAASTFRPGGMVTRLARR